jgi:two-component sensor histidine kinase
MKILIVDDTEENLCILKSLLKGNGYEVITVKNGVQALKKLKELSVDIIISDILMPEMDGFQLCRECKSDDTLKKIPFVFYTATYTDKKDEVFALGLGAEKFIVKPMENDRFIEIIKEVLENYKKGQYQPSKIPEEKEEAVLMKEYNARLITKLEHKMFALEELNKELLKEKNITETLLKEVHHRVKNNMILLSGLIRLQRAALPGKKNVSEILEETQQRIQAMARVHQMLYDAKNLTEIKFSEYIRLIITELSQTYNAEEKHIKVKIDLEPIKFNIDDAIPCALIINELFVNIFRHAFPDMKGGGHVSISLKRKGNIKELQIRDDGIGMPEKFVSGEVKSLGMKLVTMLTKQLKGKFIYKKEKGSVFTISF